MREMKMSNEIGTGLFAFKIAPKETYLDICRKTPNV